MMVNMERVLDLAQRMNVVVSKDGVVPLKNTVQLKRDVNLNFWKMLGYSRHTRKWAWAWTWTWTWTEPEPEPELETIPDIPENEPEPEPETIPDILENKPEPEVISKKLPTDFKRRGGGERLPLLTKLKVPWNDDRGKSIWDRFNHLYPKNSHSTNGDVTSDSYY